MNLINIFEIGRDLQTNLIYFLFTLLTSAKGFLSLSLVEIFYARVHT